MPSKAKPTAVTFAPDPRITALKSRATTLVKTWRAVSVFDTASFEKAGQALKDTVSIRKDLKTLLGPEIDAAKATYKAKDKLFKDVDNVIRDAEVLIRDALAAYAAKQKAKQDALIEKALDSGKDEKAAALAAKPFVPEVSGLSFAEHWHAEVTNKAQLVDAVARGLVPLDALEVNMPWLNAKARDMKAEDLGIPGVKGVKETSSTVRA